LGLFEVERGILRIEEMLGKINNSASRDRTIDIDIIFADDLAGQFNDLTIPHPLYSQRDFVLLPLMDISQTLAPSRLEEVKRHLNRGKESNSPLCIRYKSMVY